MTLLGKTIQLKGVSQRGKNRVREHGSQWMVLAETDVVIFNPQRGPWLFVAPVGKNWNDKASRWIKASDDLDFVIIVG